LVAGTEKDKDTRRTEGEKSRKNETKGREKRDLNSPFPNPKEEGSWGGWQGAQNLSKTKGVKRRERKRGPKGNKQKERKKRKESC